MTTYFMQESLEEPINGKFILDMHGNLIKLDDDFNMIIGESKNELENDLENSVEYELERKGIFPVFPYKCSICYKNVRTKDFTHFKCRDIVNRLKNAKKNVVNLEFKLFCLRNTTNEPVNLDIYDINGNRVL